MAVKEHVWPLLSLESVACSAPACPAAAAAPPPRHSVDLPLVGAVCELGQFGIPGNPSYGFGDRVSVSRFIRCFQYQGRLELQLTDNSLQHQTRETISDSWEQKRGSGRKRSSVNVENGPSCRDLSQPIKLVECVKWRGGVGVCDKGLLLLPRRCHGPSVLSIGPICLRQADLRPGMGLKYHTDLLHLQSTATPSPPRNRVWHTGQSQAKTAVVCASPGGGGSNTKVYYQTRGVPLCLRDPLENSSLPSTRPPHSP
ncbi:unnamed protein product [Pleuronectes platessa]|uniref:Uncharacterized protein n=1 Tax=Pleuronectes platessa TaxID=8262 RepID=A0A9N7Z9H2_PLEPL|nr:unnamed protein product [Pleuronectes platessa]